MKKILLSFVSVALLLMMHPNTIYANENVLKEEIVYGRMNQDGTIDCIFVVNAFDVEEKSDLMDYGSYLEVINTTTNQPISFNGIFSSIEDVEKGRFFYQGELPGSTQLPWLVKFGYSLNNQPISSKELGGKSGKLEIEIRTKQNKNVNPVYFENYLLTITLNLDSKKVSNIITEEAIVANAGDQKTIVFTSLPKSESTYKITADVNDFEMAGIQVAALPFSMAIELPDISQFTGGLSDLQWGISQLNDGANQLARGINQLRNRGTQLTSGANQLSDGLTQSVDGSKQFVSGVSEYTGGVAELSLGSKELVSASSQIKDAINLLASSLNEYAGMLTLTPEEQALLNSILPLLENIKSLLENDLGTAVFLPIAQALKKEAVLAAFPDLDLTNPQIQDLLNYMEIQASAIEDAYNMLAPYQSTIIDELLPKIDPIIKLLNGIGQISQLIDGVNELNNQYGLFHEGLVGLSNGLAQLESSSGELVAGGEQLQDGLSQLNKGASDFASGLDQYSGGVSQLSEGANQLSAGTSQLNKETKNIDSLMEERIKELMEDYEFEDFEMVSFVDEKNVNIKLVQFVFMSQPISKPVAEEEVITKEKPKSFFELFLDLFRK